MKIVLSVLWFFLPAGLGNLAPILARKVPVLRKYTYPLDGYKKFLGKRIFGDHKTVRGLAAGIFAGILTVYLQIILFKNFQFFRDISLLDYETINPVLFGFLSAFGALAGDALKSFFKRQLKIESGKSWVPADQIDYILGGILLTSFYARLDLKTYIMLFAVWFLLHPLSTFIGWILRLKDDPI
jgi:CDP-2,3-bis-(O-geranylgeranyl)-sn-glycerol synthase